MSNYTPGQPTSWSIEQGTIPPHAHNELVTAGVNPADHIDVMTFYTTHGSYAEEKNRPYWLRDLANAWGLASMLPPEE